MCIAVFVSSIYVKQIAAQQSLITINAKSLVDVTDIPAEAQENPELKSNVDMIQQNDKKLKSLVNVTGIPAEAQLGPEQVQTILNALPRNGSRMLACVGSW